MNDPGLPVVRTKQNSARLQEICAFSRVTQDELDEIGRICREICQDSSRILIWAESAVDPNKKERA
jgi:hypothetical protein